MKSSATLLAGLLAGLALSQSTFAQPPTPAPTVLGQQVIVVGEEDDEEEESDDDFMKKLKAKGANQKQAKCMQDCQPEVQKCMKRCSPSNGDCIDKCVNKLKTCTEKCGVDLKKVYGD